MGCIYSLSLSKTYKIASIFSIYIYLSMNAPSVQDYLRLLYVFAPTLSSANCEKTGKPQCAPPRCHPEQGRRPRRRISERKSFWRVEGARAGEARSEVLPLDCCAPSVRMTWGVGAAAQFMLREQQFIQMNWRRQKWRRHESIFDHELTLGHELRRWRMITPPGPPSARGRSRGSG